MTLSKFTRMDREQFELGIAEFNEGKFFECHDTFEALWMDERGEPKRFLQGLIQGAVGVFHATRGNLAGAESQLSKSLAKLGEYRNHYFGVDVEALRTGLQALYHSVSDGRRRGTEQIDLDFLPTIVYSYDPESFSGTASET